MGIKIKFEFVAEDVFDKYEPLVKEKFGIEAMENAWKDGFESQGLKPISIKISVIEEIQK